MIHTCLFICINRISMSVLARICIYIENLHFMRMVWFRSEQMMQLVAAIIFTVFGGVEKLGIFLWKIQDFYVFFQEFSLCWIFLVIRWKTLAFHWNTSAFHWKLLYCHHYHGYSTENIRPFFITTKNHRQTHDIQIKKLPSLFQHWMLFRIKVEIVFIGWMKF